MSEGYVITYTKDAHGDFPEQLEVALGGIRGTKTTHDRPNRRFIVTGPENEISSKLANIKQELVPFAASLVSITPFRADKVLDVGNKWNIVFTNMLRQTNVSSWGNWDLDTRIRVGVVGILNPETGSFTPVARLEEATILEDIAYQSWEPESESGSFAETDIHFDGGYFDPSTQTDVKVGLQASWSFKTANSIVSRATLSGSKWVKDFGVLLDEHHYWPWLLEQAKSVGYSNDNGIIQGFGMITSTTNCIGALNIGALEDSSVFSIEGSVAGITAMTGGEDAKAGIKASYKDTKESKAFNFRSWPVDANSVATPLGEVALTFQFTSFDGMTILPTWTKRIGNFTLYFDNTHGGTYIGRCYLEYSVPGFSDRISEKVTVSGGESGSIGNIPVGAYNLKIHIDFEAGGDFYFDVASPRAEWLNGSATVDLSGVWPWGSKASYRAN